MLDSRPEIRMWVHGAALEAKGQHPCVSPRDCIGSQGTAPWCESKGLYWQSRDSTLAEVQGTVLAVKGQHPGGGPRDCIGSQGTAPWCRSKGLYWQSRDSTLV